MNKVGPAGCSLDVQFKKPKLNQDITLELAAGLCTTRETRSGGVSDFQGWATVIINRRTLDQMPGYDPKSFKKGQPIKMDRVLTFVAHVLSGGKKK